MESLANRNAFGMFRWVWDNYLHKHKLLLAGAFIAMAIEGSMLAVLSRLVQPMFDDVFSGGDNSALWFVGLAVMMVFFTRAITSAGQKILLAKAGQLVAADMRSYMLRHIMALDTSFHQVTPPGQLIERVQGDVGAINSIWRIMMTAIGRDLVSLIGLFGVALWIDWQWTLVAIIGVPFLVLPSLIVQKFIRARARIARALAGRMATRLDEVFHGINPIKLNGLEDYQSTRYDRLIDQRVKAEVSATIGQSTVPALIDIMTGLGFLAVLLFGGAEIIAGEKTAGQFMAFFTAMSLAFDPLRRLGALSGQWQTAAASIERLQEILDQHPTLLSPAKPVPRPDGSPQITLDDVHLNYGDLPVLRGVSFTAAAGKTTALVGASGAGKTTVFNVLTRLVDPIKGDIKIGDTATRDMDLAQLRAMFSVVAQDAALFDETLRDNILLGRTDVADDQLNRVLDAAHVNDFIPRLADGLDTAAGPRGSNLSGGQRQRVAIARALLRDTPILLLDEATSALDTKSEKIVQDALEQLSEGRTTLVIAHRLSTIRNADSIVVMDQGRVVDQGPHDDLFARGGIYADLYNMQFKREKEAQDD